MAAEGAESLGMPWFLGVANHATKVYSVSEGHGNRCMRRFSKSSAHPCPAPGLEFGNHWLLLVDWVGLLDWGCMQGVRAGSKRRIAVQGGSVFVAKLGHATRPKWRKSGLNKETAWVRIAPW